MNGDAFWKAQLTQVTVDNQENMYIVPLLGEHIINFGNPDEVVAKLRRLKVFYKQIYPVKGWDSFSEVSIGRHILFMQKSISPLVVIKHR